MDHYYGERLSTLSNGYEITRVPTEERKSSVFMNKKRKQTDGLVLIRKRGEFFLLYEYLFMKSLFQEQTDLVRGHYLFVHSRHKRAYVNNRQLPSSGSVDSPTISH